MYSNEKGYIGEISGRDIVKSVGVGKWAPGDVEELLKNILLVCANFTGSEWGYIADPTRIDPLLTRETSEAFIKLHKQLEEAGCKAIAFLDQDTPSMRLMSQMHQNNSGAAIEVLHFNKEAEALEWMKELGL